MPRNLADAQLIASGALPASASSSVSICSIDLQDTAFADFVAHSEFLLTYPTLSTTILPDTRTATYDVITADSADLTSNPVTVYPGVVVQTGAGGAGAAGGTFRYRLPIATKRYTGIKCTFGASTTNGSAKSASLSLLT